MMKKQKQKYIEEETYKMDNHDLSWLYNFYPHNMARNPLGSLILPAHLCTNLPNDCAAEGSIDGWSHADAEMSGRGGISFDTVDGSEIR